MERDREREIERQKSKKPKRQRDREEQIHTVKPGFLKMPLTGVLQQVSVRERE